MGKIIISGTTSQQLAKEVARKLKAKLIEVEHKKFPDGESYVRLKEGILRKGVALIQTLCPQNDALVELFFLLDLINEFEPKSIDVIIPYFAYARQHKRYRKWEAISSKTLAKLIQSFGVKKLITFDLHSEDAARFFDIEVVNLSAAEEIANYFVKRELRNPFVLIPDQEREDMARRAAKILSCDYSFLHKYRSKITGEIKTKIWKDFEVKGKEVILLDDIISTGKTMLNAIEIVKRKGAGAIFVACTHYIPSEVYKRILKKGVKEIVATNTISSPISKISIAPVIVDILR